MDPRKLIALSAALAFAACGTTPPPKPKTVTKSKPTVATKIPKADVVLSLPKGWSKREDGPRVVVEGPDPKLQVIVVATSQSKLHKAIAASWRDVRPSFAGAPRDTIKPPTSKPPFTRSLVQNYRVEANQVFRQAIAHRYEGLSYVLLVRGPLAEVKKRAAQLREVLGSLRPKGAKAPTVSAKDAKTPSKEQLTALEAFMQKARAALEVPAVQVAVVQDGKVLLSAADGFIDYAKRRRKVTTKTHMMVGSITKSFTGLLIAKLVADGKLAWDTPVTELDKSFKLKKDDQTKAVKLAHLLCACTGVPRRDLPLLFEWEKAKPKSVLADLSKLEFLTGFGETFQYSNQLVAAAGYIVAKKLGRGRGLNKRYEALLRKHVLAPLGMKDSFIDLRRVVRKRRYALPHSENIKGEVVPLNVKHEGFATPYAPAGALWSTAEDFSKLLAALTAKTPKGLPPREQLEALWKMRAKVSAHATYGLGWMTRRYKGTKVHNHGGGTLGFRAYFAYLPEARGAYVILTNGSRGGAMLGLLSKRIEGLFFGQKDESAKQLAFISGRIKAQLSKLAVNLEEAVAPKRLAQLVGRYDGGELGALRIRNVKGRAIFDTGPLKMAFLPLKKAPKKESYMLIEPPLTGITFWVEDKQGKPELHFEPHTVHYVAKKK